MAVGTIGLLFRTAYGTNDQTVALIPYGVRRSYDRLVPADPDPVLRLLWRHVVPAEAQSPKRGPRQRVSVDEIVDQAIEIADAEGLDAVSMRTLASRAGRRGDDAVHLRRQPQRPGRADGRPGLRPPGAPADVGLGAGAAELVAEVQLADCREHAWLLEVGGVRPVAGSPRRRPVRVAAVRGRGVRPRRHRDGPDGDPGGGVRRQRGPLRAPRTPRRARVRDDRPRVVGGQRRAAGRGDGGTASTPSRAGSASPPARPTRPGPTPTASSSSGSRASSTGSRRTSRRRADAPSGWMRHLLASVAAESWAGVASLTFPASGLDPRDWPVRTVGRP